MFPLTVEPLSRIFSKSGNGEVTALNKISMSKYEDLIREYEDMLDIEEHAMRHEGLYGDDTIWINKDLPEQRKACILAEELGHYETSAGNILDLNNLNNAKQERAARVWAYNKLVPLEQIKDACRNGCVDVYEIAEYLDIDEAFLRESIACYESKYGDIWQEERQQAFTNALLRHAHGTDTDTDVPD